ncbi:unnamed protein product [Lactuca saligna]|uniref:Ribulose bisphosphate carboxylase large chain n=1 Tax=Lactuca saligna TaxID=75948 RepID=A0AA35ZM05_LACSI|nr:unnamed protein product [Lactuca saligna]
MSPQTKTKASVGFKAGVKDYKLTYYTPKYETKDTDILVAFRVTPQPGVPPEDVGAAVATESSTGNVFGFKSLRALRMEDLRIPSLYVKTFQGEIKGHYLNATAGTCEEMMKMAIFSRELGVPIIIHDYLIGEFSANTSLPHYCRNNGLHLHIHRATHAVIDRQKNHGIHFRVVAKVLRMSGGDHIHYGTIVGKVEREREITLGFVDLLRDDFIEKDRIRVRWGNFRAPLGNAPGAVANRVALEACVQARNKGHDITTKGNEIIREATEWSPELAVACEVW